MDRSEIKYAYGIDSSIEFEKVIDAVLNQVDFKEGVIEYFDYDEDEQIEEKVLISILRKKAFDLFLDQDWISIKFPSVEINIQDEQIEVASKIELKFEGIDDVEDRVVGS